MLFSSVLNPREMSAEDYFKYVLGALRGKKKGLIFFASSEQIFDGKSDEEVVDLWHRLQE